MLLSLGSSRRTVESRVPKILLDHVRCVISRSAWKELDCRLGGIVKIANRRMGRSTEYIKVPVVFSSAIMALTNILEVLHGCASMLQS